MTTATRMTAAEYDHKMASLHRQCAEIETEAEEKHGGRLTGQLLGQYTSLRDEIKALQASVRTNMKRKTSQDSSSEYRGGSDTIDRQSYRGGRDYASMFPDARLDNGGFKDTREYVRSILGGHFHDPRLAVLSGGEYSDPYGGWAVPAQFTLEMLDASLESEIVRPRCRVIPMTSNEWKGPRWDGYDRSTGQLFGGISSYWTKETQETPVHSTPKMEMMILKANKLTIYGTTSNELLADSPGYGSQLEAAVTNAIGFDLDTEFLSGLGVGGPMGILNDPARITVSKESGQPAATICYENLTKMFARMHAPGLSRCEWVINQTAIPQLLSLVQVIGTGRADTMAATVQEHAQHARD